MPVNVPGLKDPTSTALLASSYVWIGQRNLNYQTKTGRLVLLVHRDKASADAGVAPVIEVALEIGPGAAGAGYINWDNMLAANPNAWSAIDSTIYNVLLAQFPGSVLV